MAWVGQGIAFASIVISAALLEIYDKPSDALWMMVFLWAVLGNWTPEK